MTEIIKDNLILTKDTTFNESIEVQGDIKGYFDLKVVGNIDCENIDCWNIVCWNIVCCDKIKVKKGCKVKTKYLIKDRFSKEVEKWKV